MERPPSSLVQSSHHKIFMGVVLGALVLAGSALTVTATRAGTDAKFRMTVIEVAPKDNVVTGYITHISKEGRPAVKAGGQAYTVRVHPKKVYRVRSGGTLGRVTIESITVRDSIRVVGRLRTDGSIDGSSVILP